MPQSSATQPSRPHGGRTQHIPRQRSTHEQTPHDKPQRTPDAPGLILYVSLDEDASTATGTTLLQLMETLQEFAQEVAPNSRTMSAIVNGANGPTADALAAVRRALEAPTRRAH